MQSSCHPNLPLLHRHLCGLQLPRYHQRLYICISRALFVRERDYYDVLNVSKKATQKEIKEAFYTKSKELHPDYSNADSAAAFVELKKAYDCLRRPHDRRIYDHRHETNYQEMQMRRHRMYQGRTTGFYEDGRDWKAYWDSHTAGNKENFKNAESRNFRDEQWKIFLKWTIFGAIIVVFYNVGFLIQLRMREQRLAALIEKDEIARSFLRQAEFRDKLNSPHEVDNMARVLKADVDDAMRRREESMYRNPNEIREEYRWMRAVEEPTRYAKYKERKKRSERESDEASKSGAHPVDH